MLALKQEETALWTGIKGNKGSMHNGFGMDGHRVHHVNRVQLVNEVHHVNLGFRVKHVNEVHHVNLGFRVQHVNEVLHHYYTTVPRFTIRAEFTIQSRALLSRAKLYYPVPRECIEKPMVARDQKIQLFDAGKNDLRDLRQLRPAW